MWKFRPFSRVNISIQIIFIIGKTITFHKDPKIIFGIKNPSDIQFALPLTLRRTPQGRRHLVAEIEENLVWLGSFESKPVAHG